MYVFLCVRACANVTVNVCERVLAWMCRYVVSMVLGYSHSCDLTMVIILCRLALQLLHCCYKDILIHAVVFD